MSDITATLPVAAAERSAAYHPAPADRHAAATGCPRLKAVVEASDLRSVKRQDTVAAVLAEAARFMTAELLPTAAQAEHLTHLFRRSGLLDDGIVAAAVVESSRATVLSRSFGCA